MMIQANKGIITLLLILCMTFNLLAVGKGFGTSVRLAASTKQPSEYELKAVYLYNFLLFTSWPEPEDDEDKKEEVGNVCISILGRDPFGDSFAEIEGKVIKSLNKRLVINRVGSFKEDTRLDNCRILFICDSEKKNLKAILKLAGNSRSLTVADVDGFLRAGGMINLVKVKNKIRWEINRTPLKKASIKLSSQLLRSAVKVVEIPEMADKEKDTEIARRERR